MGGREKGRGLGEGRGGWGSVTSKGGGLHEGWGRESDWVMLGWGTGRGVTVGRARGWDRVRGEGGGLLGEASWWVRTGRGLK